MERDQNINISRPISVRMQKKKESTSWTQAQPFQETSGIILNSEPDAVFECQSAMEG